MSKARRVYLLNPRQLPPETIAVAFAKTSRSPLAFDEIAAELTDRSSAQFHEKWVVGYGHASVAEHAVLHLAIENVSRLAVEALESSRLASYTEKSTRYQKWDAESFHLPEEFQAEPARSQYLDTVRHLFSVYLDMLPRLEQAARITHPRQPDESRSAWEGRIRTAYVDVARFLLPAASLANLGITINARNLEYQLTKFFSHPLSEVRRLAAEVKEIAKAEVPTLVKYAEPSAYLERSAVELKQCAEKTADDLITARDFCQLVHWDDELEDRLLAAALYRFSNNDYTQLIERMEHAPPQTKQEIAQALLGGLSPHDIPRREIEHACFTFDIILDQGAFYELKRHRMLTLTAQPLTPHLGYATPSMIAQTGFLDLYQEAMNAAQVAYERVADINPDSASYIVPNGYNRRVLLTLNLRSAAHLVRLRSGKTAHFSIRRVARRMAEIIQEKAPLLAQFINWGEPESWRDIEKQHFIKTQ